MIREILIPALQSRFPHRGLKIGTPPEPIAVFAAAHPDVGTLKIWDDGTEATIEIGTITHSHFNPYDDSLTKEEAAKRVTGEVLDFVDALFSGRVLLYSLKNGRGAGYTFIPENGAPEVPKDAHHFFVWSGPWKLKT